MSSLLTAGVADLHIAHRGAVQLARRGIVPLRARLDARTLTRGPNMELSNKSARQLFAEFKEKPSRARFGFGLKPALVNIDLQKAYTAVGEFATAYETDPKQLAYINELAELARAKALPVVWTHVAYL